MLWGTESISERTEVLGSSLLGPVILGSIILGSGPLILYFRSMALDSVTLGLEFCRCEIYSLYLWGLGFQSLDSGFWTFWTFWFGVLCHVYPSSNPKAGVGNDKEILTSSQILPPHPQQATGQGKPLLPCLPPSTVLILRVSLPVMGCPI